MCRVPRLKRVLGGLGRRMSSGDKASPGLTIDRAAFLLLRVKKAFKKKKQQRKEKSIPVPECKPEIRSARRPDGRPAPLMRSRTLPAIVAPGLNILQAQIDARYNERRVSDSGPASRESFKEHSTRSGRLSTSSISGSQPFNRLARLLNQRPSFTPSDEIPRRLSWERSSSIDSVAEWGLTGGIGYVSGSNSVSAGSSYGLFVEHPLPRRNPSPLLGVRGDRLSLVSPNIGRRVKGHRAIV
ncbi:hypothetical protein DMN91_005612, partial [Ooceraea biroi]